MQILILGLRDWLGRLLVLILDLRNRLRRLTCPTLVAEPGGIIK